MRALQIAATGMAAQQMKVDVVSNNLANMSTTGYSPRRADFADLATRQTSFESFAGYLNMTGANLSVDGGWTAA